jgi:amino acid permease
MSQTGYILGLVFLVISAISTGFALYILCSCARRTGTKSFIGVSRAAFGNYGAYFTTTILLTMTMFVLVAYMILVRDIWSGLVQFCIGTTLDEGATNLVLIICVLVTLPMCLATNLHALRHMCYVGFSSALILTVALGYRCLEYNIEYPEALFSRTVLVSPSLTQILAAFPIMSLAFMCQFNILRCVINCFLTDKYLSRGCLNCHLFPLLTALQTQCPLGAHSSHQRAAQRYYLRKHEYGHDRICDDWLLW